MFEPCMHARMYAVMAAHQELQNEAATCDSDR